MVLNHKELIQQTKLSDLDRDKKYYTSYRTEHKWVLFTKLVAFMKLSPPNNSQTKPMLMFNTDVLKLL